MDVGHSHMIEQRECLFRGFIFADVRPTTKSVKISRYMVYCDSGQVGMVGTSGERYRFDVQLHEYWPCWPVHSQRLSFHHCVHQLPLHLGSQSIRASLQPMLK